MRQIVLDTETTGLSADRGHRVIEIGCVELLERRPSGRTLHFYLNPERSSDEGAVAVHGISDESLRDKPRFAEIAREFLEFVRGAELVIHNAEFDLGFLDIELGLADPALGRMRDHATVTDTLSLARERYPGQRNSLDALCKRLNVDASHRRYHGALLDAHLLVDVYLAMTSGQGALEFGGERAGAAAIALAEATQLLPRLLVRLADASERAAHEARLDAIALACRREPAWRVPSPDAAGLAEAASVA
jgi:DNA polymerase-3 subunit epsilon